MTSLDTLLSGKVAFLTAAGSGIGRAGALKLAKAGAVVFVTDRNGDSAKETASAIEAAGGKAVAAEMDVSDEAASPCCSRSCCHSSPASWQSHRRGTA